jgi:hypothetical protein
MPEPFLRFTPLSRRCPQLSYGNLTASFAPLGRFPIGETYINRSRILNRA